MVYDPISAQLFVLGRFVDYACRSRAVVFENDFYAYDTVKHMWSLVSDDTGAVGGPPYVVNIR